MKNIYLSFFGLALTLGSYAQDTLALSDRIKSEAIVARLSRELGLSNSQQGEVYKIMQSRWTTINDSEVKGTRLDFELLNDNTVSSLKRILTPDQYALFMRLRDDTRRKKAAYLAQNPGYRFSEEDLELDF